MCLMPISQGKRAWKKLERGWEISLINQDRKVIFIQFSSVTQSCLTLCDPMNCSTPGLPVHHQLPEFTQTHAHRVGDAIQPSHPLSSPSPPAPIPSQHQRLFQWVNSSHEVAKVLEFQLQHQSFQWIPSSKHLLISWLQSPSAVILEPPKIKFDTVSTVSPSISHEVMEDLGSVEL